MPVKGSSHAIACLLASGILAACAGCAHRSYIAMMIRGTRNVTKDASVCGDLAHIKRWRTTRDLAVMEIVDAREKGNRDRIGDVFLDNLSNSTDPADLVFFKSLGTNPTNFNNDVFTFRAARVPKGTIIEIEKIIAIDAYNIQHRAYARIFPSGRRVSIASLLNMNPYGPGPWGSVSPNPDCLEPETSPSR